MRRGTQGHVTAPRRPRAAPTWRDVYTYIYLLYIYIKCSLSSPIWGGSCGTKFMTYLPCRRRGATTGVGSRGRSIDGRRSRGARTTGSQTPTRSDGYEILPYKKACSSSFLDIRVRINLIDCLDTFLTRFSRVLPLPLQFPRPRRGRSRDLVEYWVRNRSLKFVEAFLIFSTINRLNHGDLIAKWV